METNWAADHLQTIRTLMERSAVYRRALGPIMLFAGAVGVLAAAIGLFFRLNSLPAFAEFWLATAAIAVAGAFLIARRQALKDNEPFWSPPTRRVAQAIAPPLAAGLCLGITLAQAGVANIIALTLIWVLFYGCALTAAGFFMPRGIKLFGWIFIGVACGILVFLWLANPEFFPGGHWLMGFFFGVLHLAYGAYLFLTEKGKNAA